MGCFGYICRCCGKSIRGGEKTVLRHIRHGEILGTATGVYNSYGGVEENKIFRGNDKEISGLNTHQEMCDSEFRMEDSIQHNTKIYKDTPVTWMEYRAARAAEGCLDLNQEMYKEWAVLPNYHQTSVCSGIQAFHKYCFDRTNEKFKNDTTPSVSDPNQGWGEPRKKYI